MQAVINACSTGRLSATPAVLISNNRDAEALQRAQNFGMPSYVLNSLSYRVLSAFKDRILNIHPALLPKFGGKGMFGKKVHEAVLAAGEKVTGVSVHLVDEEYDHGRVIVQSEIPVLPGDSIETLSARVLAKEHEVLIATLQRIVEGEIVL
jgi:phosphoribosylglycinamide formyltransferase 1